MAEPYVTPTDMGRPGHLRSGMAPGRVLVVDDNVVNRKVAVAMLTKLGPKGLIFPCSRSSTARLSQ